MYIIVRSKYALFLSDFEWSFNFLHRVSKNIQISNFMNIRPVGAELSHEEK